MNPTKSENKFNVSEYFSNHFGTFSSWSIQKKKKKKTVLKAVGKIFNYRSEIYYSLLVLAVDMLIFLKCFHIFWSKISNFRCLF